MRKKILPWFMVIFLLSTLGCGFWNRAKSFVGWGDREEASESADVAIRKDVDEASSQSVVDQAPESIELETIEFTGKMGLDELSAYRLHFVTDFEQVKGNPQTAVRHIDINLEATRNPKAKHLRQTIERGSGDQAGTQDVIEVYNVEDAVYLNNVATGGSWVSFSGDSAGGFEQAFVSRIEALILPHTVRCNPQPEIINDVSTKHCGFAKGDVKQYHDAVFTSLQGDIWLAIPDNYIVKYELHALGYRALAASEEGAFEASSASFNYELSDINQNISITLPAEAQSANPLDLLSGLKLSE